MSDTTNLPAVVDHQADHAGIHNAERAQINYVTERVSTLGDLSGAAAAAAQAAEDAQAAAELATSIAEVDTTDDAVDLVLQLPGGKAAGTLTASFEVTVAAHDDFTEKPDSALTVLDSGQAWAVSGARTATIRDGAIRLPSGVDGASYPRFTPGGKVTEAGGKVSFAAGSTNSSTCTILVTPDAGLDSIPVHFVTGPTSCTLHYKTGATFDVIGGWNYDAPLAADVQYPVGVGIYGNTVVIRGADGNQQAVRDPRIDAALGDNPYVMFEPGKGATTDREPAWHEVYANTQDSPRERGTLGSVAAAMDEVFTSPGFSGDVVARIGQSSQVTLGDFANTGLPGVTFAGGKGFYVQFGEITANGPVTMRNGISAGPVDIFDGSGNHRVSFGAADSAGAGFRTMRVPN